ncbi:MAG TPA: IS1380 family transposase, partial [Bacteroides uniformis]|nr:IS1380 family transposase [Bacteroides uniformis]
AMSEDSLKLVLQKKHKKSSTSMTKISIKSGKLTSFGGIFSIMEQFDSMLSSVINSTL